MMFIDAVPSHCNTLVFFSTLIFCDVMTLELTFTKNTQKHTKQKSNKSKDAKPLKLSSCKGFRIMRNLPRCVFHEDPFSFQLHKQLPTCEGHGQRPVFNIRKP